MLCFLISSPLGNVVARQLIRGIFSQHDSVRGGTLVEGTAGNTGIGLTAVANTRGYRAVIVIPETQTLEKKDALRQLGARLVEVPARPYRDPDNYIRISGRLAKELGAVWCNQFDNTANRDAHIVTPPRSYISPKVPNLPQVHAVKSRRSFSRARALEQREVARGTRRKRRRRRAPRSGRAEQRRSRASFT